MTATDLAGNTQDVAGTLTVEPLVNPNAPVVTLLCPTTDGGRVLAGADAPIRFSLEDDDTIERYELWVDGVQHGDPADVLASTFETTALWPVPADAVPGQAFRFEIRAVDVATNVGSATVTLTVPTGTVLSGDQSLDVPFTGQHLTLGAGTYTATVDLEAASLELLPGAVLTTPTLRPLTIMTPGDVVLSCDASVDASARSIHLEFNERFTSSELYTHDF